MRLWNAGATYREISDYLGIGAGTLERVRAELKLPKRNAGVSTKTRVAVKPSASATCLCCGRTFATLDRRINRVCGACKQTQMWSA